MHYGWPTWLGRDWWPRRRCVLTGTFKHEINHEIDAQKPASRPVFDRPARVVWSLPPFGDGWGYRLPNELFSSDAKFRSYRNPNPYVSRNAPRAAARNGASALVPTITWSSGFR